MILTSKVRSDVCINATLQSFNSRSTYTS